MSNRVIAIATRPTPDFPALPVGPVLGPSLLGQAVVGYLSSLLLSPGSEAHSCTLPFPLEFFERNELAQTVLPEALKKVGCMSLVLIQHLESLSLKQ